MISYSSSAKEGEFLIDKDYIIYLDKQLGKGGFGCLYLGKSTLSQKEVAIKSEEANNHSHLIIEYEIMESLKGGVGIPSIYKFIKKKENNYLIMELLGKSLDKLFSIFRHKFSLKTVIQLGYQMIERIEYVHSKGFIHRDIKPGNFLIGLKKNKSLLYIIDFGLSKRYRDKNSGEHIPYRDGKGLTGTSRYVSLFTHNGIEQSRRDDIEGIAYNLIYLSKGKLPWQGVKTKNKKEKHRKIKEKKESISPEELCEGLPEEFCFLLKYARNLTFEQKPEYYNIKLMFQQLMTLKKFKFDNIFEWDKIDLDKEGY